MAYEKTEWKKGDIITAAKMNKIEEGIANGQGGILFLIGHEDEETGVFTYNITGKEAWEAFNNGQMLVVKEEDYYNNGSREEQTTRLIVITSAERRIVNIEDEEEPEYTEKYYFDGEALVLQAILLMIIFITMVKIKQTNDKYLRKFFCFSV